MEMTIRLAEDQPPFRLGKGQDLSIPLVGGQENLNAWYIGPPTIGPHIDGDFVGSVEQGASTNFNTITFNPHAHVTHTECLGHISKEFHSVNRIFPLPFLAGVTLSVTPEKKGEDQLITEELLEESLRNLGSAPFLVKALLIRTLPNVADKRSQQYSHSNPPYLTEGAAIWLREMGVEHLLIDLPSVDREVDGGALQAHKAFWGLPAKPRTAATITEFIFVPNEVEDGFGFLDLQVAPIKNDASPSRPVWYKVVN